MTIVCPPLLAVNTGGNLLNAGDRLVKGGVLAREAPVDAHLDAAELRQGTPT